MTQSIQADDFRYTAREFVDTLRKKYLSVLVPAEVVRHLPVLDATAPVPAVAHAVVDGSFSVYEIMGNLIAVEELEAAAAAAILESGE